MKIDLGVERDPVTPSRHDVWTEAKVPPPKEWRDCHHHAYVTTFFVQRDGKVRFVDLCPACLDPRPNVPSNLGEERARREYGSWRVTHSLPREAFKEQGEFDRIRIAKDWLWRARYHEHLNSEKWRQTRVGVLARSSGLCESCGAVADDIHHLTYERLGFEPLADLMALCRNCHSFAHGRDLNNDSF